MSKAINIPLKIISLAAFLATVVPAILYLAGNIGLDETKDYMLAATVVWFVATPFWMDRS